MYTAWNTGIRILFHVPDTHRYLIESISQCLHVKTMLASRCVSYYETIEASSKLCIRFLLRSWVFATNLNIPVPFQPGDVNLWYFKLRLHDLTEFIAWNI